MIKNKAASLPNTQQLVTRTTETSAPGPAGMNVRDRKQMYDKDAKKKIKERNGYRWLTPTS